MAGVILLGTMLVCGIWLYVKRRKERLRRDEMIADASSAMMRDLDDVDADNDIDVDNDNDVENHSKRNPNGAQIKSDDDSSVDARTRDSAKQ